jgi:hypothetical protein
VFEEKVVEEGKEGGPVGSGGVFEQSQQHLVELLVGCEGCFVVLVAS